MFAAPVEFGYGGPYDFIVARYNTDGSLDTSFDGDGKATVDLGGTSGYASDVAMDASGTICGCRDGHVSGPVTVILT